MDPNRRRIQIRRRDAMAPQGGVMSTRKKNDASHAVTLIPSREEIGSVERLRTMDCDDIMHELDIALDALHGVRLHFMANCLLDLVWPFWEERERAEYRWVLASDHPDTPGIERFGCPE